jgi:riboflavin kinase/FMN adenylyltransferase
VEIIYLEHANQQPSTFHIHSDSYVMALGFFDGVHLGHQRIIQTAKAIATQKKLKLAVLTFFPHPKEVLQSKAAPFPYLSLLPAKQAAFADMGVDILFIVEFTHEFSRLTPDDFVDQYIVGLQGKHVVAGFDFTYGYKGEGNMDLLQKASAGLFAVTVVDKLEHSNQKISSTVIRNLLSAGHVSLIPDFLGDYYETWGTIKATPPRIQLSYRKAKIIVAAGYLLPKQGVYKIQAKIEERWYDGICHLKRQEGNEEYELDVQMLGCSENVNGKHVKMRWIEFYFDRDNRVGNTSSDQEGDRYAIRSFSQ